MLKVLKHFLLIASTLWVSATYAQAPEVTCAGGFNSCIEFSTEPPTPSADRDTTLIVTFKNRDGSRPISYSDATLLNSVSGTTIELLYSVNLNSCSPPAPPGACAASVRTARLPLGRLAAGNYRVTRPPLLGITETVYTFSVAANAPTYPAPVNSPIALILMALAVVAGVLFYQRRLR
jgi:hypothetical protein